MPKYIINLRDEKNNQDNFMEWSSVVDAPTTNGMTLAEFKEYYRSEYGNRGMEDLDERLTRVFANGTSARMDKSVNDTIGFNVAGSYVEGYVEKKDTDDGSAWCMTYEELLDAFCRPYYKDRV
jgi:hypothetical protein